MEEFAKMIYEQWLNSDEAEEFNWGREYEESWQKVYDILNEKLATDIECSINKKSMGYSGKIVYCWFWICL